MNLKLNWGSIRAFAKEKSVNIQDNDILYISHSLIALVFINPISTQCLFDQGFTFLEDYFKTH